MEDSDLWIDEQDVYRVSNSEHIVIGQVFLVWSKCGNEIMIACHTREDAERYIEQEG